MTRFFLAGNGSWLNRGCEAIELATRQILDDRFPGCEFTVGPFGAGDPRERKDRVAERLDPPDWTTRRWGGEWCRRTLCKKVVRPLAHRGYVQPFAAWRERLDESDALLQVGGDNFTLDYGRPDSFFALNDVARRRGCPVVLWGASVGPFSADRKYERFAARRLAEVDLILVREAVSERYLSDLGVVENVVRTADPAFLLAPRLPGEQIASMFADRPIGVNVSPLFGRYAGLTPGGLARETVLGVRRIHSATGQPVVLLPHVLLPSQDDAAFLGEVAAQCDLGDRVRVAPATLGAAELKWCAGQCACVAAARTHLTIAAFSSHVPTISLAYSAKARGLNLDLLGHERYLLDAGKFSGATLCAKVESALEGDPASSAHLAREIEAQRRAAAASAETLASLLGLPGRASAGAAS